MLITLTLKIIWEADKMQETYCAPEMELIYFQQDDVITTSCVVFPDVDIDE